MSNEPNKPDSKDLPINIRMLVAFALTGLVIFGTPYFYKVIGIKLPEKTEQAAPESKPQPAPKSDATQVPAAAAAPATSPAKKAGGSAATDSAAAGMVAASTEETVTLDTDLFHIVFSNRGGVVKNWTLKKFPDHEGKPLDVVLKRVESRGGEDAALTHRAAEGVLPSPGGFLHRWGRAALCRSRRTGVRLRRRSSGRSLLLRALR